MRVCRLADGDFEFRSFLEFTDAGDMLDCRYEITTADGVVSIGAVEFSVEPMGVTRVTVPIAEISGREAYIRFIFTAKEKTLFWEPGYEVCFDQVKLCEAPRAELPKASGHVEISDEPLEVCVTAGAVKYVFSKRRSAFTSICVNGRELLDRPLEFNFFRAPVDNDVMKGDWYRAHLNDFTVRNYGVCAEETEAGAEITLRQSFGWSIHQPFAYMDVRYLISPDGALSISCSADMSNKVEFLPRFGVRMFLPGQFRQVEYYGYGPYESYADKHQASYVGRFTADIAQLHEGYIRPQENGSHCGCRFMTISDGESTVRFTAPESFSFNASQYTQEELASKRHNFELEKCGSSVVCVDGRMAGVGSNSCGPALAEEYRLPLPKISAEYRIEFR